MKGGTKGGANNRRWVYLIVLALVAFLVYKGSGLGILPGPGGAGGAGSTGSDGAGAGAGGSQTAVEQTLTVEEDGTYDSREEVALYLYTYGKLPPNYIKKSRARELGWKGGNVEQVAPGKCLGGDRFGNRERTLPGGADISYRECDIGTLGKSERGPERLVYSNNGFIYYTGDHYETFELLYDEDGPVEE